MSVLCYMDEKICLSISQYYINIWEMNDLCSILDKCSVFIGKLNSQLTLAVIKTIDNVEVSIKI